VGNFSRTVAECCDVHNRAELGPGGTDVAGLAMDWRSGSVGPNISPLVVGHRSC
jgi:hypothetical protein